MEKGFERQLQDFQELAARKTEGSEDAAALAGERTAALASAVELTETDPETQEKVYALQKDKLGIMTKLKEQLKALDDPSIELHEHGRTVSFDAASGMYLMREKGGKQTTITLGEIMTGGAWGQRYRLDGTVDRGVRKEYLVAEARRELMDILNQQIAVTEAKSWFNKDTGKDDAYAAIAEYGHIPLLERKMGVIAEQLVSSLLARVAIDHNLPFEVIQADVHADVEYKIDFIIRVKENDRGVSVTTHEGHDIGIQFTTKTAAEDLAYKKKQAARASRSLAAEEGETVERIVVVSVPVDEVKAVVKEWQANQKHRTGGPDKLLPSGMQEKIFKGVLRDVFAEEAVDRMWSGIQGPESLKAAAG